MAGLSMMICVALAQGALTPNPVQRQLIERRYGMFIHFGVNTFRDLEWSDGTIPASAYNPTKLDADSWVKTAKEAGFRHVVLTAKHHDGFCLWPSAETQYSVAASPVKTDVVAEVSKACKKYGVEFGIYYSLWDRHEPSYKTAQYFDFMKAQLTELLTGYGPIAELWFDGGWDKKTEEWRFPELYAHIKRLQPNCAVTVNHTITSPESPGSIVPPDKAKSDFPIRYWPVDFRTKDPNLVREDDPKIYRDPMGMRRYLPFEHTICLSDRQNWFQKKAMMPARSIDELEALFYWCTSQNNAMLLNVPPDDSGRLRKNEVNAILELADRLRIRGGEQPLPPSLKNQALGAKAHADSVWSDEFDAVNAVDGSLESSRWAAKDEIATLTIIRDESFDFDRIILHEYLDQKALEDGFSTIRTGRVELFEVEALIQGKWTSIHKGKTIGAAKIISFSHAIKADSLRIRVQKASAPPSLYHISVSKLDR